MRIEDVEKSRKILGLGNASTLADIKEAYRSLARENHPDKGGNPEKFIEVGHAHKTLMDYVENYKYSFKPDDVTAQLAFERIRNNYMNDPMWGSGEHTKKEDE
ncbi:MAG TPA: molecular chaperone DnaJ [Candidatus Altiarchaeales archaeon]|nr:molecular chaperone DnaJ [Candidatus Altiarchaeales archaeon]